MKFYRKQDEKSIPSSPLALIRHYAFYASNPQGWISEKTIMGFCPYKVKFKMRRIKFKASMPISSVANDRIRMRTMARFNREMSKNPRLPF